MSLQACGDIVQRGDPDRFLAAMAAGPAARAVLFPIYAFNIEVSRAPWLTKEPMIAEMRLQWWRDALDEIAQGGIVRRHEVVLPLAHVLDPEGCVALDGLIAARRADIEGPVFTDGDSLFAYLDATAGHLMWAAVRALGGAADESAVRAIARAAGLVRMFAALPALVAANRAVMPSETETTAWAERALAEWPKRSGVPHAAQAALLEAWQARPLLRLAQKEPNRLTDGLLKQSEFARRAGLIKTQMLGL